MTVETTMFLPCNEGEGTTLTNTAGPGTKTASSLGASAWSIYNATTRPAVKITQNMTAQDVVNSTPYSIFGNSSSPAPYNPFTMGLVRFEGAISVANIRIGGASSAHSIIKSGTDFSFTSGSRSYYTKPWTSDDRIIGFSAFTEGLVTDLVTTWCVIEYDPSDGSIIESDNGRGAVDEPDSGGVGYLDDGGYAMSNADFLTVSGSFDLYGMFHARVSSGEKPTVAATSVKLEQASHQLFQSWISGNKVVPASLLGVASMGSGRVSRARRSGARR